MSISIGGAYSSGTTGTLQISGLSSSTDWGSVIDKLITADKGALNKLTSWKQEWSDKITALQGLNAQLLTLHSQSGDISDTDGFFSFSSSSSDENVLTASTYSGVTPGSHNVTVGSNIPHRLAAQGWADRDTTSIKDGAGDFQITVGDYGTITIDSSSITASTTLQDLGDLINNDPENSGDKAVTASIINDGSSMNPYRLEIAAKNGGPDYTISITANPTGLNFYQNDIAPPNISNLTASTTTAISTGGSFTEDKSTIGSSGFRTYTFTGPATDQTVGSGDWTISWAGDNGGGSGTINLGSGYTPGDTVEIEDGVYIQFGAGVFEGGDKDFSVKAFSTDVSDPEMITWDGTSAVSSAGNYLGSTSKTFNFAVSGTGTKTIGTDTFMVTWSDNEGNKGTLNVTSSDFTNLSVSQGVKISFGAGTIRGGDTFSLNVYNANLQDNVAEGLAKTEVETHSGFVDEATSPVTTTDGTFSYVYGGVARTITIPANTTLEGLQDIINNDDENPGVTASIVNDGSGLSTAYHLQLTGDDLGAAYSIESISHTLNNFAKGGTSGFGFTQTQRAQNAMLKVDGYPTDSSEYIQRTKNTVGDIINGVTMRLASPGTSNITIASDTAAIKNKVQTFVDTINSVLGYINSKTKYDASGKGANNGILIGNYAFAIVQSNINNKLSDSISGLVAGKDTYTYLAEIGIHTDPDQDGKWVIDRSVLDAALSNDSEGVSKLFIADENNGTDGVAELINIETDKLTQDYTAADPGIVSVLVQNYQDIIKNIDIKLDQENNRLEQERSDLNRKFANLETALGQLNGTQSYITNYMSQTNKKS